MGDSWRMPHAHRHAYHAHALVLFLMRAPVRLCIAQPGTKQDTLLWQHEGVTVAASLMHTKQPAL